MDTLWQDIRYALRVLARSRGFTIVAVLTLALGIGANTAIFSLTDQVLLRRLPVAHPAELVILRSPGPNPGHISSDYFDSSVFFSYPEYKNLRDRTHVFSGLLARYAITANVAGRGLTEEANGELVSGNYFGVLGVQPALGRIFTPEDETAPGANPVAVLSYGYWARHFGSDPGVINQPLTVNGASLTVVGVAGPGFDGIVLGQPTDLFIPITMKAQMTPNWNGLADPADRWVALLGRLKPGLSAASAEAGLAADYRAILEDELPLRSVSAQNRERFLSRLLLLDPGSHGRPIVQHDAQPPLIFLVSMAALVLLITAANLASLQVARGEARRREIAVRLALGAGRGRLIRQLLTESILLSLAGGAAGLLVASWTLSTLISSLSQSVGVMGLRAQLDPRVLAFAFALSLLTGILFGLAPASRSTRADLQSDLKEKAAGASGGASNVRLRKGLIVSQIALTALLLTAAGLFTRSLTNLRHTNLGVRLDHMIQFSIGPARNRYTPPQTIVFADRLRETVAALPGVRAVSAAVEPVFADSESGSDIEVPGYTPAENENMHVLWNSVGPGYFAAMGIPLLEGRELTSADGPESPRVAVINETLARRFFTGRNPIGQRFSLGAAKKRAADVLIAGVVADSKHIGVREEVSPFVYFPYAQNSTLGNLTFYVRTMQDPASLAATLRETVRKLDADLPVTNLKTLAAQVDDSIYVDRLLVLLSLTLGLLAALLAAVGLYGVMAYVVARRTREIGIRIALGATRQSVAWLVLREVIQMASVGIIVGFAAAYAVGRLLEAELYGVKGSDPLVYLAAGSLLALVAVGAGLIPTRKATSVDPMVALRYE